MTGASDITTPAPTPRIRDEDLAFIVEDCAADPTLVHLHSGELIYAALVELAQRRSSSAAGYRVTADEPANDEGEPQSSSQMEPMRDPYRRNFGRSGVEAAEARAHAAGYDATQPDDPLAAALAAETERADLAERVVRLACWERTEYVDTGQPVWHTGGSEFAVEDDPAAAALLDRLTGDQP